jgi:hypothetical protein
MTREYSIDAYTQLVTRARHAGYEFVSFLRPPAGNQKLLYLRHDVDYSLSIAVRLAEVNAALGVSGTFCVLLRSGIYNLFSPASMEAVRRIRDLGQWVALHFACPATLPASDGELAAMVARDHDTVSRNIEGVQPVFSWHNPTPETLERGLSMATPGLVNAYSRCLFKDIRYCSDSVMRRSPDELEHVITGESPPFMQILLHPLYWVIGGSDPVDVLARSWIHIIRERAPEMQANAAWAAANPRGISERALAGFSASLLAEAITEPGE